MNDIKLTEQALKALDRAARKAEEAGYWVTTSQGNRLFIGEDGEARTKPDGKVIVADSFDDLKSSYESKGVHDKEHLEIVAYRSGSTRDSKRGTFFANNRAGAQAYSRFREDRGEAPDVVEYRVEVGKTLIAGHQNDVTRMLFNKPYGEMMDGFIYRNRGKPASVATAKFDEKIARRLKQNGYEAVVYTKPAPPADMELCVFSTKRNKPEPIE